MLDGMKFGRDGPYDDPRSYPQLIVSQVFEGAAVTAPSRVYLNAR